MLFTSYAFIGFLAVALIAYYAVPKKLQWITLLATSYVFYAFAGLDCLVFILFTTVSSYVISRLMAKNKTAEDAYIEENRETLSKDEKKKYRASEKKKRLGILVLGLLLNFGILAVLKYTAFALTNVNSILGLFGADGFEIPDLLLPMGISFYTFQTMGYLIDVYRGRAAAEKNIAKLALFVSFFPQLVQGPISRFSDLAHQLTSPHVFSGKAVSLGLQRVLWGYAKKLIVADRLLVAVKALATAPDTYDGAYVLLLILLYSVQIYADFTGGIDITIGIAEAMGIKLTENFDRPFSSKSTKEYWRRWHITMGSWFRDYIFLPLSVCSPMLRLNKKLGEKISRRTAGKIVAYAASAVTWFATGVWHGAAWNFIVWGMLNFLVISVSESLEPLYEKFHAKFPRLTASAGYGVFMSVRTFLLMGVIRSLDCYRNVGVTFAAWGSMLTMRGVGDIFSGGIAQLGLGTADIVIIVIGIMCMFAVSKLGEKGSLRERLYERPALCSVVFGALFVCVILFGAYGVGYDASQFIYDQF